MKKVFQIVLVYQTKPQKTTCSVLPSQDNKTKQNSDILVVEIRECLEYFLQKQWTTVKIAIVTANYIIFQQLRLDVVLDPLFEAFDNIVAAVWEQRHNC